MAVLTTLYPPIVNTYMPAFPVTSAGTGEARIYFSYSPYTDQGEVASVWISIVNPHTNLSVLDKTKHKTELIRIKKSDIKTDTSKTGDDKYYIVFSHTDLADRKWQQGFTYKAQLRFCTSADVTNTVTSVTDAINAGYFSEWSSISLLQPIEKPTISILNFPDGLRPSWGEEYIFSTLDNMFTGNITIPEQNNDTVYSYRYLIHTEQGELFYDSGDLYPETPGTKVSITHNIHKVFEDGVRYTLTVSYTTQKYYSDLIIYNFLILDTAAASLQAAITAMPEIDMGRVKIHVISDSKKYTGNLTIRRTSSKSNFTIWEDIHHINLDGYDFLNEVWYDYSIESGVWYKYCVQRRNLKGARGLSVITPDPVMVLFHDMFLVGENEQQLKIKFNPQITSYAHTLMENSVQTIGSKYPFIKRNGQVHYKQFNISGLISLHMDEEHLFISKNELYDNETELYSIFNNVNKIGEYNDIIAEKRFRDQVETFLYDGKVKLFKSNTEGNMFVRLMNITLNPETALGRMLYSFSATAYEIDDNTIENLTKYNIQPIGTYAMQGKINTRTETFFWTSEQDASKQGHFNLRDALLDETFRYQDGDEMTYLLPLEGEAFISALQLQMLSDPYFIAVVQTNNQIEYKRLSDITMPLPQGKEIVNKLYGYFITMDGAQRYIPETGVLNLAVDDVIITDLTIPKWHSFTLSCKYNMFESENLEIIPKTTQYRLRDGQEMGTFQITDNVLYDFVYQKYLTHYMNSSHQTTELKKLFSINDLTIEAEPGTVFYLQDAADYQYYRYVVNDTGFIDLSGNSYTFTGLYFAGVNLRPQQENTVFKLNEFKYDSLNTVYENVSDIQNKEDNTVYKVKNFTINDFEVKYIYEQLSSSTNISNNYLKHLYQNIIDKETFNVIYYQGRWCIFTDEYDVLQPTYGIVTYQAEIERSVY